MTVRIFGEALLYLRILSFGVLLSFAVGYISRFSRYARSFGWGFNRVFLKWLLCAFSFTHRISFSLVFILHYILL